MIPSIDFKLFLSFDCFSEVEVLNKVSLRYVKQACKYLDASWSPKFTEIVAQKRHHMKFFQAGSPDNVPPGWHSHILQRWNMEVDLFLSRPNFLVFSLQEPLLIRAFVNPQTMTSTCVHMLQC